MITQGVTVLGVESGQKGSKWALTEFGVTFVLYVRMEIPVLAKSGQNDDFSKNDPFWFKIGIKLVRNLVQKWPKGHFLTFFHKTI